MGLFTMLRFLTPNGSVSVSEAGADLTTTAALGQAVENLDTYASRINGSNTATSAYTLDASAASDTAGLKLPSKAGAAPIADGFIAFDTTTHRPMVGVNGVTAALGLAVVTQAACSADYSLSQTFGLVTGCTMSLAAGSYLISGNAMFATLTAGDLVGLDIINSTDATPIVATDAHAGGTDVTLSLSPRSVVLAATKTIILRAVNNTAVRGTANQFDGIDGMPASASWLLAVRYA